MRSEKLLGLDNICVVFHLMFSTTLFIIHVEFLVDFILYLVLFIRTNVLNLIFVFNFKLFERDREKL